MQRNYFGVVLVIAGILAAATPCIALEAPKRQTFPFLEEEFRLLDEQAFAIASGQAFEEVWTELGEQQADDEAVLQKRAEDHRELTKILIRLRQGIAAKYGEDSREVLDMYRREAQLQSLASNGEEAIGSARKAVAMARKSAPAYALFHPNDPMLTLSDQIVAYQDFVTIAAEWQDEDVAENLAEEAFQVAQLAELTKPALIANRRLLEHSLEPGEIADLARLAGMFVKQEGPLTASIDLVAKMGEALRKAGQLDDAQIQILIDDLKNRDAALKLIEANADKLEAALFPEPVTLEEIQGLLDEDEAYVAFVSGESFSLTVFCVTRDAFAFRTLETVSWMKNVEEFRGLMGVDMGRSAASLAKSAGASEGDPLRLIELGWTLYSELFSEIEPLLAGKSRLLLSLHGELMRFPFEALVTQAPDAATTFATAAWFVKDHAVTVLPTIALLRQRGEASRSVATRFLGIGNPDYRALADWEFGSRETAQIGQLRPLPESANEVRHIGALFNAGPDDMLLGAEATEMRLQEMSRSGRLAQYDIILFATHGLQPQEMDTVFEASLALTPTREAPRSTPVLAPFAPNVVTDGLYKSREIETLRLEAELIILSACNSASNNVTELDGYSGLASAFMQAGAGTVMVSHWPVISDAAVEITTRTMANLEGRPSGKPLALALRAALIETIGSGGDNAHPRYWAPFSLFGAP